MSSKIDLSALQAKGLPRLDWRDMLTFTGEMESDDVEALDKYFSRFATLSDGKCLNCDRVQGGLMSALLGGGFVWDIAHGEGHCSGCGYPARGLHYDVGPIKRLEMILQYHPDVLKPRPIESTDRESSVTSARCGVDLNDPV